MNNISAQTTQLEIRGLKHNINEWGDDTKPLLIYLHGWMDCGASCKFMAPYLSDYFYIVAPDLRGFGDTEHSKNGYWYPDYFADIEVLLEHYSPTKKVNMVGHSMGANIALIYAGLLYERVEKVMALDGLGLSDTLSRDAPKRFRDWIKDTLSERSAKVYPDEKALKTSIRATNPNLSDNIVNDLCALWARPAEQEGAFVLKHDQKHRHTNPQRYNFSDIAEIWKQVQAKVAILMAADSWHYKQSKQAGRIDEARALLNVSEEDYFLLEDVGHMVHLEQPEATARCIKQFFR